MRKVVFGMALAAMTATTVQAGGLLGDAINVVAPGVGTQLDEAHRGFKHANPKYGKAEEKLTNDVRRNLGLKEHCEPLFNKYGEQVACQ
ncbi:hypothetical protein [uncultured Roseobacter sp.]|uniref:hypothetical protein n=1 Tax=uncultured Roseobacter sp. TaxID=114847 RepID=UPI00261C9A64|nr:hypothetical protein [uncultured Roseobacter sp.]